MTSNLLNIGASALQLYQRALNTSGHNIANTDTPGYNRQQVIANTSTPSATGNGFIGSGVQTQEIRRIADEFVINQVRLDTSSYFDFSAYDANIRQLDNVLADEATALSTSFEGFFNAMQASSTDPSSIPARQLVLTEADGVRDRFQLLYETMTEQLNAINTEVTVQVESINRLGSGLAELNQSIGEAAIQGGGAPNDLLDQREALLRELTEIVGAQVVQQDEYTVNVFIGKGQPLVIGNVFTELSADDDIANPGRTEVFLQSGSSRRNLSGELSGGALGGLLRYRDGVLDPSLNQLGVLTLGFMEAINNQQREGLDLSGAFGERLFTDMNDPDLMFSRVSAADTNALPADRQIEVIISDIQQVMPSDYEIRFLGPGDLNYAVTRLSDGETIRNSALAGELPETITIEGLDVTFVSGSFQVGDRFFLRPYREAAGGVNTLIDDPRELAFAVPIRAETSLKNLGTGSISQGEILQIYDSTTGDFLPAFANKDELSPPILVRFNTDTTYDVLDNTDPANPVQLEPPLRNQRFIPGTENSIFTTDPGATTASTRERGDSLGSVGIVQTPVTSVLPALPTVTNGYSAETINLSTTDAATGLVSTNTVVTSVNATAQEIANQLNAIAGVSATSFNKMEIRNIIGGAGSPIQLTLNGQDLTDTTLGQVPTPAPLAADNQDFAEFLVERINNNGALSQQGIYAVLSENAGVPSIRVFATTGVDLDIQLVANGGDGLDISNGESAPNASSQTLVGVTGQAAATTIGGTIDVHMVDGIEFETVPGVSSIFGDTLQFDFQKTAFLGYQVEVEGRPKAGDRFTVDYNSNAKGDNRNAFELANLATAKTLSVNSASFNEYYAGIVEVVGGNASQSRINVQAGEALLRQSENLHLSSSGVNLDEEAANLIRFEQAYNAAAQLINVARQVFDSLIATFR